MISPKCDFCGKELDDLGGLLFSPPDENNNVKKEHICKECYGEFLESNRSKQVGH